MSHVLSLIECELYILFRKWVINISVENKSFIFITGHLPDSSPLECKNSFPGWFNTISRFSLIWSCLTPNGLWGQKWQVIRAEFFYFWPWPWNRRILIRNYRNKSVKTNFWSVSCCWHPKMVHFFYFDRTQILGRCFHGYNFLENSENFDFLSLWSEKSRSMFQLSN